MAKFRSAAIRHPVYGMFEGANHGMAYYAACEAHCGIIIEQFEFGFVNAHGEFVNRDDVSLEIGKTADALDLVDQ